MIVIFEPEQEIILEANAAACAAYGYDHDELVGMSLRSLTRNVGAGAAHIQEFLQGRPQNNFESIHFNKGGEDIYFLINCSSITSRGGKPFSASTAISPRSRRKQRFPAQCRTRATRHPAHGPTRSRQQGAGVVRLFRLARLRAPLRAISGFTNILVEDYGPLLDAEAQRVCSVISGEAGRMRQLIDDLLSFSRLSRTEMRHTKIDMHALVEFVFHELTTPESRERIDLQVGSLAPAMGDPALMRQVWANLLSNALKFTSKKERAVIEVGSTQSTAETVYSVRDNGAGFDMRYVDKLFGVFQRLHSENEFEGTGVGLAIVQRVVLRHGGRVWGEGQVGNGAVFYFALPGSEDPHE